MANGYFKLVQNGTGYGLKIIAPSEGGEPVRVSEAAEYLMSHNYTADPDTLKEAMSADGDAFVALGFGTCPREDMTYKVVISDDSMEASLRLYPASDTGINLSVDDIVNGMEALGVKYGIDPDLIAEAIRSSRYRESFVVARGDAPIEGTDAHIEYYFNTDLRAKPTVNEDGSVDFFHLNMINSCKEGDLLAKLTPAVAGESGTNLQGVRVKPHDVHKAVLKYGRNIQANEDRTELRSLVNGHVSLVEGMVMVSDVLEVENVDTSTGNIDYEGSVSVDGNVQSNFSVKAQGNIIVNGLVEGAFLDAGGDIIIARGVAGASRGEIRAKGNVVAKFLESARVIAGGNVTSESILHSQVTAAGDVSVDGRKGFISGGRVCATSLVQVKTLGSTMGTATSVEVGADPEVKAQYNAKQKELAELNKIVKSLDPIVTSYVKKRKNGEKLTMEQLSYLSSVLKLREQKVLETEKVTAELAVLRELIDQQMNAQVKVRDTVYPGVKIIIGELSLSVQSAMQYCRFIRQGGDVKMVPMD